MVETSKQVRLDNWGIYFLQRLQLFFSKTDYCDLTLQFEGNVQLKVHRLVMNACTEYFAFLEQSYPALEENTIMMPSDLQADVIVPIVNFMYTGMLEFHPSIYKKLYRAAEIMNMVVLIKLLEAQLMPGCKLPNKMKKDRDREPLDAVREPKEFKKQPKPSPPLVNESTSPVPFKKVPWKRKTSSLQSHPASATYSNTRWNSDPVERDSASMADNTPKPTRFEWPDDLPPMAVYSSFDVSLTSKPLWTEQDNHKSDHKVQQYSRKRTSHSNDEDVDDPYMDKDVNISQLDDSRDGSMKRKADIKASPSPKRVKISNQDDETIISITTSNPSEVDHTKIVSEILKKYPDLVKKKKNIKLRISQSKPEQPSQIKVQVGREKSVSKPVEGSASTEKALVKETKRESAVSKESSSKDILSSRKKPKSVMFKADSEEGPWTCLECRGEEREGSKFVLYYLFRKHMTDQHQIEFDSSFCKYCGKVCSKEKLMIYHLYTKHGLKLPKDVTFPNCHTCPFIAVTNEQLATHLNTHGDEDVQCLNCQLGFKSKKDLQGHQQMTGHLNKASTILQCAYCKKKLQSPVTLFTHVRVQHMKDARRDGIVSLDEIMDIQNDDNDDEIQANEGEALEQIHDHPAVEKVEEKVQHKSFLKERIKLISNVKVERLDESSAGKLGSNARIREAKSNAEPVAVTAAAATLSNLGGSLATNLGLVDIVVLDDNQQYILQQPQGQSGDTEFILPPELTGSEGILQAAAATGELNSTDELVMVLTDDYQDEQSQDQSDNSNIVVLYSHPVDGQQGQFITSQGNLLVNSEGMLEIRNGAAITTTAGQLLVNNGSTTTTQAAESPIESIDLIRREIEASEDIQREDIKNVLSEKEPEIEKKETEESTPIVEISNHQTDNNFVSNYVQEEKNADTTLDMTDSSTQDEAIPMEMNDLQLSSETGTDGQIMSQDEPQIPIQDPENVEGSMSTPVPASSQVAEEASTCLVNQPILKPESLNLEGELLMNAPQNFQSSIHEISENVEPMEVDTEQMPNETLCNTKDEAGVDEIDNTLSNTVDAPNENSQEYLKVNDAEPLKEESVQKLKNNEEANFEQSICAAGADICEENENPVSSENHEHGEPVGENNPNDSNDNLQDSYGAFTEETQRSSTETSQKDLNKEILEDWDDTDSQQSQTQEQQAQDAALINVSENVSELMDDWEEEDEDQTKG
ncbi:hypothetical protein D910_05069 [Dendroctonus ponderosae]|uniref:BTB domain-containing protein n=1 Tax=Dendroctonus ponderosae TaxID=77166 RepID=U4U1C5_DENPD|nr:hypothetical protein D910_05069 [Dendroctonus ponderosae]